MSRRAAGLLTVAAAVSFLISPAVQAATDKPQTPDLAGTWLISPQVAVDLIKQGALVIDARGADLKRKRSPLPGAVSLEWQDLSEPSKPVKGRPLPVGQATPKLQALGITKDRPVIVLADSVRGWGEDGRVVWLLRHWGHTRAVLVDGGITALERGCAEFCVNGQSNADASRPVRKHHEYQETRRTRRTAVWPAGQLQEARRPDWRERTAQAVDQAAGRASFGR